MKSHLPADTFTLGPGDLDALALLRELDASEHRFTDWEVQFIGDLIDHPRPLTPRQRETISQLAAKYEFQGRATAAYLVSEENSEPVTGLVTPAEREVRGFTALNQDRCAPCHRVNRKS